MAIRNSSASKSATSGKGIDCLDLNVIDAALEEVAKKSTKKRPEGFTAAEYAEKKNIGLRYAQQQLLRLYQHEYVDRTMWKDHDGVFMFIYQMKDK